MSEITIETNDYTVTAGTVYEALQAIMTLEDDSAEVVIGDLNE